MTNAHLYTETRFAGDDALADLRKRWVPDQGAVDDAVALLRAVQPDRPAERHEEILAAIPMYQPGKTHGIWTIGQEVVTVRGAVFFGRNGFDEELTGGVPSYSWARNAAADVARAAAADFPGTIAYATVSRDGSAAVFEDF